MTSSQASRSSTASAPLRVPFIDLVAQFATIREEVEAAVRGVFERQTFVLGPEVRAFEAEAATYLGCRHAIGVASGTDALVLALRAAGVGAGDEVIVPPFTFGATALSVRNVGAIPVFADIDPRTFNLDPESVRRTLTPKTKALIPVHLYGLPADMDALGSIARDRKIALIEDAAQAFGAAHRGRKAGTLGTAACFSFYPTKNLGGAGDGGLVTTDDDAFASRVRVLREHGSRERYVHDVVGTNSRLDELQAAVLRVKLRRIDAWNAGRRRLAGSYRAALSDESRAQLPVEVPGLEHIYHLFVVRVSDNRAVRDRLIEAGIGCGIYYPSPLHVQPAFRDLGQREGDMPHAERACREVLALPIYAELPDAAVATVSAALRGVLRATR
ncbi:MAG: DegT/DnrJ/EryC1/StrS family aminotransferase [Planctomycetes bacterium]|nr:DegT/DnrJ/EryC1/StrS family aminotransferase [Planctomycetota bacterium]MBI3845874.1 DegT/DnrJ/EryC1/StrS family aminotransferase [Planctomycetota bacterium]